MRLAADLLSNLADCNRVPSRGIVPAIIRLMGAGEDDFREHIHGLLMMAQPSVFCGRSGPYLKRWDIGDNDVGGHCYVHEVLRADEDSELHSHPWDMLVLILAGGYQEVRPAPKPHCASDAPITTEAREPGCIYSMSSGIEYHRIAKVFGPSSWSLVLTSPKRSSWDFLNISTNTKTPWRNFIEAKGLSPIGSRT